jgi:hypothetical protein
VTGQCLLGFDFDRLSLLHNPVCDYRFGMVDILTLLACTHVCMGPYMTFQLKANIKVFDSKFLAEAMRLYVVQPVWYALPGGEWGVYGGAL